MKKLFIMIIFTIMFAFAMSKAYIDGWKAGYQQGWKYIRGRHSYAPYAPYPTYPRYGEDTYNGGYNRGFIKGMTDAQDQY